MRNRSGAVLTAAGAWALVLALAPVAASAQTPDFSIPGTRPTSNPRAQGPVDDEVPVVRTTPRPTPTQPQIVITPPVADPTPSAPAQTAPARAEASVRPAQAVPRRAGDPQPRAVAVPGPRATGAAMTPTDSPPVAENTAATSDVPAAPSSDPFALPSPVAPAPTASGTASGGAAAYWPWIAGAAALLAALFGLLWWRGRKPADSAVEFEAPVVPAPAPAPPASAPAAQAEPQTAAEPERTAAPAAAPAPQSGLVIALEARRMSASLVATTLNYVLRLTNTTAHPLSALAVEGDMVAAHGSLPPDQQIASDDQRLELRHALVNLAPGESAEFSGDFRLPLATLVPIRAGDAAYFVPLARWRIEASTEAGAPLVQVQTFVIGELPDQPGGGLRPFRLDLGPRTYSRLGQRAVS